MTGFLYFGVKSLMRLFLLPAADAKSSYIFFSDGDPRYRIFFEKHEWYCMAYNTRGPYELSIIIKIVS